MPPHLVGSKGDYLSITDINVLSFIDVLCGEVIIISNITVGII